MKEVLKDSVVDEQSSSLLAKINQIAETVSQILNLRFNLRCKFSNQDEMFPIRKLQHDVKELKASNVNPNDILWKKSCSEPIVDTLSSENSSVSNNEDLNDLDSTKFKRRLPKETLDVLNEWYQENIENPYLTRDDINMLKSRTSLSENQIKNWASNKRRKRKETKISQEVSELLGPI